MSAIRTRLLRLPGFRRAFLEFEPESWTDWARIPWSLLRYGFALLMHRLVWPIAQRFGFVCRGGGRWDDWDPVWCPRCFWAGPARWLCHTYAQCGDEDVEPVDECPRCGLEEPSL